MSADNHARCPKCINEGLTDTYNPLREWIDVGMGAEFMLEINYRCRCSQCLYEYAISITIDAKNGEVSA